VHLVAAPELFARAAAAAGAPSVVTPDELAALLKDETEKWSGVIKVANIALDY